SAYASCTEKWMEPGWLLNYDGTIGEQHHVRASFTAMHDEVTGVYFYVTQLKDIHLKGRIVNGMQLIIDELGPNGKVVARFDGEFAERDPRGRFKGVLHCEVILGSWHKIGAKEELPFSLYLENGTYGTLDNRYGGNDDNLIHSKAYRFWNAVIKGDKR